MFPRESVTAGGGCCPGEGGVLQLGGGVAQGECYSWGESVAQGECYSWGESVAQGECSSSNCNTPLSPSPRAHVSLSLGGGGGVLPRESVTAGGKCCPGRVKHALVGWGRGECYSWS